MVVPETVATVRTAPVAEPWVRFIRSPMLNPEPPLVTAIPETCPLVTAVILKAAPVPDPEVVQVGTPVVYAVIVGPPDTKVRPVAVFVVTEATSRIAPVAEP
jgi:hypothetical protein